MKIVQLNTHVAVSEQLACDDLPAIAAAGYKVVVNNRPDGEVPGQPTNAEIEQAALAAGLQYHYLPITATSFPGSEPETMRALFDDSDNPVLAFCRTGTRCANLWVSSRTETDRSDAYSVALSLGYDLALAKAN